MMAEGLEYNIVVSHGEKIVAAISTDPKGLALSLHAKGLISNTDLEETNELNETKTTKARKLYSAVKKMIQHHPGRYDDFIRTFKDSGKLHCDLLKALNDSEDAGKTDLVRHGSDSNISEDSGMDNISLDSLSVNCQCPCGVTDFSHYLCPPPDCLANRHSSNEAFPELDLGADKKAGSVLEQHLAEETESIQHKFTSYSMSVYHWAKSIRGIDDSLKQILRTRQQTIRSDNFEDLYASVTAGIDFINYESLDDHVMEACRNASDNGEKSLRLQKKAEDAAKTYENSFREYSQLRVFLLPSSVRDICSDNQEVTSRKELKIKIEEDFRKFPLKRIAHFKKVVRKLLNLPHDVLLRVTSVEQGCVEMSFEIVGAFPGELLNLSLEQKKALVAENITLMEYAGMMQYCCCELLDNEVSRVVVQDLYEKVYQADYQQDNLDDVDLEIDENEHSPDCPCIHDQGGEVTECQLSPCVDCGACLRQCALEYHMLNCEKRVTHRVFSCHPASMVMHKRPTLFPRLTAAKMKTRKKAFRVSLVKIASRLNEIDIQTVCYIHDLSCPSHCGLSVMGQLCARGVFSECETKPLVDTLNHIGRVDLANIFLKEYVNVQTQNKEDAEKDALGDAPTFPSASCFSKCIFVGFSVAMLVLVLCLYYLSNARPTDGKPNSTLRDYRYQSHKLSAELFRLKTQLQCIDGLGKPNSTLRDYCYQSRKLSAELFRLKTQLQCIDGLAAVPSFYFDNKKLNLNIQSPALIVDVMLYVRFETYFMSYSNRTLVLNTGTIFDYQCSTSPSTEWCIRNVAMIPLSENKNGINGCIETYFVSGSQEVDHTKASAGPTRNHRSYCRCRDRYLVSEYLIWFQDQLPATYSNETWYLVRYTAEHQDSMKQIKSSTTTYPLCIWNATNRTNPN